MLEYPIQNVVKKEVIIVTKLVNFSLDEAMLINKSIFHMYHIAKSGTSVHSLVRELLTIMRNIMFFDKGNMIIINYDESSTSHNVDSFISLGWKHSDVELYIHKYFGIDDVIPMLTKGNPIAFRNNDFFSLTERKKTKYYKEFIEKSNIQTSIDANILLPGIKDKKMVMGFFRDPAKKDFSDKDLEIIKLYQPHLSNIFSSLFSSSSYNNYETIENFTEAFDTLGICVLDSDFNPISFNGTYSRFVCGDVLNDDLTKSIQNYCQELSNNPDKNDAFESFKSQNDKERRDAKNNYIIEVTQHLTNNMSSRYIALIYSVSEIFMFRFKEMTHTYNLSTREYEVLMLMIGKGLSAEKIASVLFISTSTVKKHISSAYRKMGINSQKQLMALLKFM